MVRVTPMKGIGDGTREALMGLVYPVSGLDDSPLEKLLKDYLPKAETSIDVSVTEGERPGHKNVVTQIMRQGVSQGWVTTLQPAPNYTLSTETFIEGIHIPEMCLDHSMPGMIDLLRSVAANSIQHLILVGGSGNTAGRIQIKHSEYDFVTADLSIIN